MPNNQKRESFWKKERPLYVQMPLLVLMIFGAFALLVLLSPLLILAFPFLVSLAIAVAYLRRGRGF